MIVQTSSFTDSKASNRDIIYDHKYITYLTTIKRFLLNRSKINGIRNH